MRSKVPLFALLLVAGSLALPLAAHAGGVPFFGPIIPPENNLCAAGWGMLVTVINNIISLLITLAIVFVAPLMIAYSGFLFVVNPVNSGGKEKAKGILTNTVVGIVIALAGWMIVDAIMAALYNANAPGLGGIAWSDLITGNPNSPCLIQTGQLQQLNQSGATVRGMSANGGRFLTLPTSGNCTPSNILNAVAGSNYRLSQSEANTLSCIAVPESTCGNNTSQARQPNGTPTSASGMFQIVFGCQGCNDTCHNLNIQACSQAAGVSGSLDCSRQFSGGLPRRDSAGNITAAASACQRAAANLNCNAQAAACLVRNRPNFGDWTADSRATTQRNCVALYANR